MKLLLVVLPLLVIIGLLLRKQHMLVAAFAGGLLAVIIGRLDVGTINGSFLAGVEQMMGVTIPILYAATAALVAKAGSIQAIVDLARHYLRGRLAILAGFLVLVQSMATYMAGMGAGNTMVIAPLVAIAVGFVPEVVAGLAIATAVGFTTSPASTETVIAAEMAGRDLLEHSAAMMPFTILFFLIGAGLAAYGVHKRGSLIRGDDGKETEAGQSVGALWKKSIPAIALLVLVVAGNKLNQWIGISLFTPATTIMITTILTVFLTGMNAKESSDALIDGSRFILVTLFSVGIFLGFINMIGEIGTFAELAALAGKAPVSLVLPAAMVIGFLTAIPAGAFAAGVLALVLPTLSTLGMPSEAMGFVAMAVGLGTQVSPVQINVAALSDGFEISIMDVIRANLKYVIGALVLLIILGVIFV
ncbi:MAG: hypothetical protein GX335_01780 [Firmicutes bacterium]|nr:hypothetical protein [Bacillota bacterium]